MSITIDGNTSATSGGVAYGNGTTLTFNAGGTAGQVLLSGGTGVPTWGSVSTASGGTGLSSPGASGNYLVSNGTVWTSAALSIPSGATIASPTITSPTITNGTMTSTALTTVTLTNPTVTNYVESVVAIGTVSSSSTLSLTNGTVQTATLSASTACTFTMPTAVAGKSFMLLLKQDASSGNGTATFTGVKWGTSGAPTITATAGKMDILSFISDGTNWYGSISQGYTP